VASADFLKAVFLLCSIN